MLYAQLRRHASTANGKNCFELADLFLSFRTFALWTRHERPCCARTTRGTIPQLVVRAKKKKWRMRQSLTWKTRCVHFYFGMSVGMRDEAVSWKFACEWSLPYKCMRMMLWVQKSGDTALILCVKNCYDSPPDHKLALATLLRHGAKTDVRNKVRMNRCLLDRYFAIIINQARLITAAAYRVFVHAGIFCRVKFVRMR